MNQDDTFTSIGEEAARVSARLSAARAPERAAVLRKTNPASLAGRLFAIADGYDGPGVPFVFMGADGPRLVGHALAAQDIREVRPTLDAKLAAQNLSATFLSTFRTANDSVGYLAHG